MTEQKFKNKMTGCWIGKNSGGTLGGPLEKGYGEKEMFHIDWYPSLPEGGIPNDDLEMQLVWLQVLRQKGPGFTAHDLAQSWMDSIKYNFDEYGFAKVNMNKGLLPPVCSWYNNPFKDCMGSPIRSEIWACVAPGHPEIAAYYAFMDAICDHGGGESVFGEVYNAVMQSMAFFIDDPLELTKIGLKAIPEDSLTAACISEAMELHSRGEGYEDARHTLYEKFYDSNAQYSPLNLGFQTIGLLYGTDFGDAMCKAVNCGYDTDCTGATVGATLGIILGYDKLPSRWIEPLGKNITVNIATGGIENLETPTEVDELTEQTYEMTKRVLAYWGKGDPTAITKELALENCKKLDPAWLESYKSNTIEFNTGGLKLELSYQDDAAIIGSRPSTVKLSITNENFGSVDVKASLMLPEGFSTEEEMAVTRLKKREQVSCTYLIRANSQMIKQSNVGFVQLQMMNRPIPQAIPLVLCGGRRFFISPFFKGKRLEDATTVPESEIFSSLPVGFKEHWTVDNDLQPSFSDAGVVYYLHEIFVERQKDVYIGVPTNGRSAFFLNGSFVHETTKNVPFRPDLGGVGEGDSANYAKAHLEKGWNQLLIKLEALGPDTMAHLTLSSSDDTFMLRNCGYVDGINEAMTRLR